MTLTLRERLLRYFKARPGVRIPSGEIQRIVTASTSYTPANATRRLRELAEEGLLQVDYVKNHAHYWYQPKEQQVRRIEIIDGRAVEIIETITA